MPPAFDVVVIGSGVAGAATAFHLGRLRAGRVLLVERETLPGCHASGHSAAMGRSGALSPAIRPLAREGLRFLGDPPVEVALQPLVRTTGALFLMGEGGPDRAGEGEKWLSAEEVERRVPATRGGAFAGGVLAPRDGVIDVSALLHGLVHGAIERGVATWTGRTLTGVETAGGRVTAVRIDGERVETPCLVDAAGAWADEVAGLAGLGGPLLRPCRRHLFVAARSKWVDVTWPIVWDLTHGLYFRPESGALLLSACDEVPWPPGDVAVDPAAADVLAEKVARCFPALTDLRPVRCWAGLRTLTADGGFALGRDPRLPGFVWCAGLGGHGITVATAAGRIAAEAACGRPVPPAHAPERLLAAAPV